MYAPRPPEARIDRYAGPYERWVFSDELGRPCAFPAVRRNTGGPLAAILEGAGDPCAMAGAEVRLPPLWPAGADHVCTPFLFHDSGGGGDDTAVARCLGSLAQRHMWRRPRLLDRFRAFQLAWYLIRHRRHSSPSIR